MVHFPLEYGGNNVSVGPRLFGGHGQGSIRAYIFLRRGIVFLHRNGLFRMTWCCGRGGTTRRRRRPGRSGRVRIVLRSG